MTDEDEVFGLDDELPSWTEEDADDVPEELEDDAPGGQGPGAPAGPPTPPGANQ